MRPPHPLAGRSERQPTSFVVEEPLPTAAAIPAAGPTGLALGRALARTAKSCGARGSHFPALFDYFNLERNLV